MVCRCLYILLGTGQFCNSSTICWIAKDFALAVLSCCNLVGRPDFALCCTILFGSGSADRPMLTQFNHIVSGFHNIPQSWPNQRELCLICGIVSEWMDCRRIFGTAPEDRPLFASFFESTHSHHHVCLAVVAISSIVVAAAWGCKIWMQSNPIYIDCTSIPNYPQLSHNPMDYKKRDPRLRQDFKILKMALGHG